MSDLLNHQKTNKWAFSLAQNDAFVRLKGLKLRANPWAEQINLIFKTHNHFSFWWLTGNNEPNQLFPTFMFWIWWQTRACGNGGMWTFDSAPVTTAHYTGKWVWLITRHHGQMTVVLATEAESAARCCVKDWVCNVDQRWKGVFPELQTQIRHRIICFTPVLHFNQNTGN